MRQHHSKPTRLIRKPKGRMMTVAVAIVLLLGVAIGGTIAWLSTKTTPVTNTFTPAKVTCDITENFNENTGVKTKVNVTNTGNIAVYIRVKLVTYRTNDAGQHIGGTAELPTFTPGKNWVEKDGYYYYTLPVEPNAQPKTNLTDSMTLAGFYEDADGGKQALDVMAEAIQSEPEKAVGEAWGVCISQGSVTDYSGN